MNTLKIKTTVSKEREVNIDLPVFWKRPKSYEAETWEDYLGVIDENNCIALGISESYVSLVHCTAETKKDEIIKANNEWERISEEDFLNVHKRLLSRLSLEPQLTNVDDVKDVL